MFIELTDHLRCPANHDESFLVLIPDEMRGREVVRGILGCPACSREYRILDRVAHFGPVNQTVSPPAPGALNAAALGAFLGLEGPGGYVGLIGEAASFGSELTTIIPGIHLVAVNPASGVTPGESMSVVLSPRMPFKQKSLRGIVLGAPFGEWSCPAVGAVLPGLRAAGHGPPPQSPGFSMMAEAEGWWVGKAVG
jgi:hypothetical protein